MNDLVPSPLILLVDDEEHVRRAYAAALEAAGFRVVTAADCEGAVKAVHAAPPDVVLMDAMMPEPDGFYTLRQLRTLKNYQPRLTGIMWAACAEGDLIPALSGRNEYWTSDLYDLYVIKGQQGAERTGPVLVAPAGCGHQVTKAHPASACSGCAVRSSQGASLCKARLQKTGKAYRPTLGGVAFSRSSSPPVHLSAA